MKKSGSGAIQQTIWWLSWQVDLTRMIWLWYDSWFMMYTDDWTMDLVQWIDGGWRGWWLTSGVGASGVLALYMMLPKTVVFLACTEKNDPETECPIRDCSVLYFLLHSGFHPNLYGATRHPLHQGTCRSASPCTKQLRNSVVGWPKDWRWRLWQVSGWLVENRSGNLKVAPTAMVFQQQNRGRIRSQNLCCNQQKKTLHIRWK